MKQIRNYHLRTERWRDIKDYEGLYQVSNFGRVRSFDKYIKCRNNHLRLLKGRILSNTIEKVLGYYVVGLTKNGVKEHFRIHRLVAEAFIPNPHNLPTVDHINAIRTDNRVENLRWADMKLQMNNEATKEHLIDYKYNRKDQSKPVLQYTLDGQFVAEYPSIIETQRQTGICRVAISRCCLGKPHYNTAGGYIWKYKE